MSTRLVIGLVLGATAALQAQTPCGDATAGTDGRALIARAVAAAGIDRVGSALLRYDFSDAISQNYQSDRMYPPYLSFDWGGRITVDPGSGVQRVEERLLGGGSTAPRPFVLVADARASFVDRDTAMVPFAQAHFATLRSRPLDAWSELLDWSRSPARVVGCRGYREYPRTVVERDTRWGRERLYLDPKSGLPVKLDRTEADGLRGDVHVEYLWTNWEIVGGVRTPIAAYRLVDGEAEITRTVGVISLVPRDSVPRIALADTTPMPVGIPEFAAPDTVRVSERTFLLVNRAYTNVVTLQRDTVFVLDAQLGDYRARQDSAWIGKLFPGRHPIVLVVTDLAWPHIEGVRFWVARGATVISHPMSRGFLERVVARRWTTEPDLLTRTPGARLRFVPVRDSLRLAGGAITLQAIDGLGSEGALMAYFPGERFLYAGDYVQTVREPSAYAEEVAAAVQRAGATPDRVAAMHLPLTPWATVLAAQSREHAGVGAR